MHFRNSRLAETFEQQVTKTEPSVIRAKAAGAPEPKLVPKWARLLLATADTQMNHFYYTIRAWTYGFRSQLIDNGIVQTFDELKRVCLDTPLPIEGGGFAAPKMLLIDSGGGKSHDMATSRTNEVYEFCLRDPERIKPTKGSSSPMNLPVRKHAQPSTGMVLWLIDTEQGKDHLSRLIRSDDVKQWLPHAKVDDDYCNQLASEHKTVDPKTKKQSWTPKTSGAPNHYWDCEVLQVAGATDEGAGHPDQAEAAAQQTDQPDAARAEPGWQVRTW